MAKLRTVLVTIPGDYLNHNSRLALLLFCGESLPEVGDITLKLFDRTDCLGKPLMIEDQIDHLYQFLRMMNVEGRPKVKR